MKKRFFSLALCILLCFSMVCPSVLADDSVPEHEHKWVDCGINFDGEVKEIPVSVSVQQCSVCKMYLHSFNILGNVIKYPAITGYTTMTNELVQFLAPYVAQLLGKNATAEKAPSGIGRKDLPGYADDNGTPTYNALGILQIVVEPYALGAYKIGGYFASNSDSSLYIYQVGASGSGTKPHNYYWAGVIYRFVAPVSGLYYIGSDIGIYDLGTFSGFKSKSWKEYLFQLDCKSKYQYSQVLNAGDEYNFVYSVNDNNILAQDAYKYQFKPIRILIEPLGGSVVKQQTNITINNNTWNGNIYTDNSTNLTYIYPQYTTINEKNETVTNISNTPVIYNNETKQYYTYDQTTKNYYYITYNAPSPSPTPAPTEKPGGSISTPETGKPGGDTGDTTGILAVLVEIRDNMIQGFLDIKAAFVAGFAELSANFKLAIEYLNVNIQNIFNKKFPDQSTPETAQPTPTPSPEPTETPSPTEPPSPTPSPSPAPTGKPDDGGDTNNFWNIFIGGGSDDGTDGDHKGIFWALVSLILALIAFFTNLFAGVAYLFPFLPEGVVMTINTCLFVVFLFVIIKFIMRSK